MPDGKMPADAPVIVITTLAMYQTRFWATVGGRLRGLGVECVFLSFDDRSTQFLSERGFAVHGCAASRERLPTAAEFDATLNEFDMRDANYWFSHERITFGIADSAELQRKLWAYLRFADRVIAGLVAAERRVVLLQEVGGFLCVIASYFAARRHGVDNWFIEPSFFRGRLFFTKNTFGAPQPASASDISDRVLSYLDNTRASRSIVVPIKDRHHYSAALKKVANLRNAGRLVQKVTDKYLLGKHQEFGYIGKYVSTHLSMLANSRRLRSHYRKIDSLGPFVYFPFHVPADMALTLRAPRYLDQLALIDYLLRILPHTHVLAVKEHPAMIGALDARRLIALKKRYDNLAILPPTTNNYDVLGRAQVVVSINSKSGAEALLMGKPVVVLGDAFYGASGLVHGVDELGRLGGAIEGVLSSGAQGAPARDVDEFLQGVWNASFPGELFVDTVPNATEFAESTIAALGLTSSAATSAH